MVYSNSADQLRRDLKTHLFEWHCVSFSAIAVFSRNPLYKSTFYLLTYLLTRMQQLVTTHDRDHRINQARHFYLNNTIFTLIPFTWCSIITSPQNCLKILQNPESNKEIPVVWVLCIIPLSIVSRNICVHMYFELCPAHIGRRHKATMRVSRLTVAYIGPKSRTESPRKTKTGTEVDHVTRDSDTTFEVKRSKVNLQGAGAYCGGLPHSFLYICDYCAVDWSI